MRLTKNVTFIILILLPSLVKAEYLRVGSATATVESASKKPINYQLSWLENSKGEKLEFPSKFKNVDTFMKLKNGNHLCVIQVKPVWSNVIGLAVDTIAVPNFYGINKKDTVGIQKISPTDITFSCIKL